MGAGPQRGCGRAEQSRGAPPHRLHGARREPRRGGAGGRRWPQPQPARRRLSLPPSLQARGDRAARHRRARQRAQSGGDGPLAAGHPGGRQRLLQQRHQRGVPISSTASRSTARRAGPGRGTRTMLGQFYFKPSASSASASTTTTVEEGQGHRRGAGPHARRLGSIGGQPITILRASATSSASLCCRSHRRGRGRRVHPPFATAVNIEPHTQSRASINATAPRRCTSRSFRPTEAPFRLLSPISVSPRPAAWKKSRFQRPTIPPTACLLPRFRPASTCQCSIQTARSRQRRRNTYETDAYISDSGGCAAASPDVP